MNVGAVAEDMVNDYYGRKPKKGLDFSQAIEDYTDEMLTGLTKEEREAIDAILKKYMDENPGDVEGYINLYKALLKKFGFKGNADEYAEAETVAEAVTAGNADGQPATTSMRTARAEGAASGVEKVTDANGDTFIVIKTSGGAVFRMKVSEAGDESAGSDIDKKIKAYEKNLAVE